MKELTKGNPLKNIIYFCIPVLIGAVFNLFYSLADTRIIGSYLGADALAAVGSISTLGDFITGIVIGFTGGFGIFTAQLYGMGKLDRVRKNFYISLETGTTITALLMLFSHIFITPLMNFLNIPNDSRGLASGYILIIINGLIFSMIYNVLLANLRAIGDTVTPLVILIISALMNVGLDILLVGFTSLGVEGAALATILSQALAALTCFIYMLIKYPNLRPERGDFTLSLFFIKNLLSNGISMALMSCLVIFGTLALQTTINTFGENIIIAHTAARKITMFYMLPNSVFSTCMATYCGQNYGAGKMDRIKTGIKDTLLMSYGWAIFVVVTSYTIAPLLIFGVTGINTDEIIHTACLYLKTDTLFYVICHSISVLRSALQGMGDKINPVISSGLELVVKVLIANFLAPRIGYWGIIWSEPITWCIMIIPLIISIIRILFVNAGKFRAPVK